MTDIEYEYRVLTRSRFWYGPGHPAVQGGRMEEGWREWSEWQVGGGYNRSTNHPYRTLRGAKSFITQYGTGGGNDNHKVEREYRIQRRPVKNDWEDLT